MSDYKIRVDVASDYSLAVEAAKINGNLDDLKLKVSSVKKENGKNIITFSDGSQAVINDGATPTINDDGYWIINGQSTGVKGRAEHNFNELTDEEKLSIKGDKGDPLTWPDLTPSNKEEIRGPRGYTGPASKVTNTSYDSYGNTVLTFNDGTKATVKKGDKGDKGNPGTSVSVSSVTKSGLTNTVRFSDGKSMQVKDGESVKVSSSRFLDSGDTEVSFSDGSKAVIKKGVDGSVAFDKLTDEQRKSLVVPVVDDLTSGGRDKALSAEQGKELVGALADLTNKLATIKNGYEVGDFIKLGNLKAVVESNVVPMLDREFPRYTTGVNTVAVDGQGNTYCGTEGKTVIKLDSSGSKIWEFDGYKNQTTSVVVDNKGNVYSGDFDGKVMKISPSGEKIWEFTEGNSTIYSVAVDSQGNVYSGDRNNKQVKKISPSGSKIWGFTGHIGVVNSVAVDSQGNVYSGGYNKAVLKLSSTGVRLWEFHGQANTIWSIAVDSQDNIYSSYYDGKVKKINPSGGKIWEFTDYTTSVEKLAVDGQGNVYSVDRDKKLARIKQEGDTKIVGYEVIK